MELLRKTQRKRKSAGIGDIFEVEDKDLSPEPEDIHDDEPEAKVLKTFDSDVSDSRRDSKVENQGNQDISSVENSNTPDKVEELCNNVVNNVGNCDNNSEKCNSDVPSLTKVVDALEEGEVNDVPLEENDGPQPQPAIIIKFVDKFIADLYKLQTLKFFQSLIGLEIQNLDDETINIFRNSSVDPLECIVVDGGVTSCKTDNQYISSKENVEELAKELPLTPKGDSPKKKKKKKKQSKLFVLDTNPGVDNQMHTQYDTKFLINDENQEDPEKANKIGVQSGNCFNCGQNHSLRDCPVAHNYSKINANRQKFIQKYKTTRYHLEEEQKYSHLQPGKISPALRKALGLKKNQIPSYIYQMRILGYPPGWLEEAKEVESELELFDIDGNNVKNTNTKPIKGLDPKKVIHYPGFNVPLEKDFKDEHKYHRVPPYSDDFSKEKMIEYFRQQCVKDEDDFETKDMDLDITDEFIVIDNLDETIEAVPIQNKKLDSVIDSEPHTPHSPSLNDLEKQKLTLLEELKKRDEVTPWDYSSEDTNLSASEKKHSSEDLNVITIEEREDSSNANVKSELDVELTTTMDSEIGQIKNEEKIPESSENRDPASPLPTDNTSINSVKHTAYGTPIIKSNTPYNRLPDADNFSKGVSPVIDFENLPNSTGKYEQMTGILQKVRETLKKNVQKTKT